MAVSLSLRFTSVPAATLFAFKVLPGTDFSDASFAGLQSDADWSALYAQFSVDHAVRYLANHYDRGASEASLVAITTRRELHACVCTNGTLAAGGLGGSAKAQLLRQALVAHGVRVPEDQPLMQAFGDCFGGILVILDAEELECVLPHQLVSCQNFAFEPLCTFSRDAQQPWATAAVRLAGRDVQLELSKDEKLDAARLGQRLAASLKPNVATTALALFMPC